MSVSYIIRRFLIFLVVVWAAASFNFLLPRLGGTNPVREKLISQASLSGAVQAGLEDMIAEFEAKFGIDQPLWKQYLTYMKDMARFDFNYSIVNYPRRRWGYDRRGSALDDRAAAHYHDSGIRDRQFSWRLDGMA